MASSTGNLGLRKPDPAENWSVANDFNANMDKIDQFAGQVWLKKATLYVSGQDPDNYTTPGFYHIGATTHSPLVDRTAYGILVVYTGATGHCQQLFISAEAGRIFMRGRNSSNDAFSAWQRLANASEITQEGVTLTAASGVTIVTNRSYRVGKVFVLCVKGYTSEAKTNGAKIFDLPFTIQQSGIPIPIGIGTEWSILDTGYGYARSNDIGATLTSGQYFHINATFTIA